MERCLITGASRGIGRAIACKLATPDRELLLHGRDQEALVEVYTEVETLGGQASILTCDLTDTDEISQMIDKIGSEPLHALINNAGMAVRKPLAEISLDDWHRTFAVNVTAPFLLTQKLLPCMTSGSSIVNILSVSAKTAFPNWSSYCMSKFALEGFSLTIREELRSRKVRVINIYPGSTATGVWDNIEGDWPVEKMMSPDEVADAVVFAMERSEGVLVESIDLGNLHGTS